MNVFLAFFKQFPGKTYIGSWSTESRDCYSKSVCFLVKSILVIALVV